MPLVTIAPIVEGHGEVQAVRTLIERTLASIRADCVATVLQPIRVSKAKVVTQETELLRAVDLAALKLSQYPDAAGLIVLLLDSDADPACVLAPRLLESIHQNREHLDVACVLPVIEFETWLVAGADSLGDLLRDEFLTEIPSDPDQSRAGKGWVQRFFKGPKYSETVDQVRLTARFDVAHARRRSRSFDKFCRELEKRCRDE